MIDDDLEEKMAVEEPVVAEQTDSPDRLRNKIYAAVGCLTMFAYGIAVAHELYNHPSPVYRYSLAAVSVILAIFVLYKTGSCSSCNCNVRANDNDVDSDP